MCPAPPFDIDVWEMGGPDAMNDDVPRPSGVSSAAEPVADAGSPSSGLGPYRPPQASSPSNSFDRRSIYKLRLGAWVPSSPRLERSTAFLRVSRSSPSGSSSLTQTGPSSARLEVWRNYGATLVMWKTQPVSPGPEAQSSASETRSWRKSGQPWSPEPCRSPPKRSTSKWRMR